MGRKLDIYLGTYDIIRDYIDMLKIVHMVPNFVASYLGNHSQFEDELAPPPLVLTA